MSIAFVAYDLAGDPLPGLTPSWSVVVDAANGSAISPAPTFTELGDGAYKYNFSGSEDLTGIIDLGSTANPRYMVVAAEDVVSFGAFDSNGAPLTGLTPTWNFLRSVDDGTAFTPQPTVSELSGGLYKFDKVTSEDVIGVLDLGGDSLPDTMVYDTAAGAGTASLPRDLADNKTQFVSTEDLDITFPPFVSSATGEYIIGTDIATMDLKSEGGTLLNVSLTFDGDVDMWRGQVPSSSFEAGEWRVRATSDDVDALPQFQVVWWGDYVDDIPESRQAALGRWKVESAVLTLYEEDGVTLLQQFDLKDSLGAPTDTEIFDKDPI